MPASEGTSLVSEMPFSPWQALQVASCSSNVAAEADAVIAQTSPAAISVRIVVSPRIGAQKNGDGLPPSPVSPSSMRSGRLGTAGAETVDRAIEVIRNQQRAVFHHLYVDRTADVVVVRPDESRDDRLD